MIDVDELHGQALEDVNAIFAAWRPPSVSWPPGTTIVEQQNSLFDRNDYVEGSRVGRYWSRYHLVTLPSGGQLITLTQSRDTGDEPWAFGRAPHLIWHAYVDGRTVIAAGHVANMSIRKSRQHEHYGVADWILHELGLGEGLIKIGELSRKLRVRTRVETDGYEY